MPSEISSGFHDHFVRSSQTGRKVGAVEYLSEKPSVKSSAKNLPAALGLAALGVALGAAGIYLGETDDAPGAALLGILLMIGALILAVRIALRRVVPKGE